MVGLRIGGGLTGRDLTGIVLAGGTSRRMGGLANTPLQNIVGTVIVLIVSALGIWNIAKLFLK